jgi:16S rRNA (guanine527-N7)-methyltransferase
MPHRLNQLLAAANSTSLDDQILTQFTTYLTLLQKWNAKTNLTAIRDEDGILSRHFLESILCARALPSGIHSLLDFGSGAGFPGLPIAILRPDIQVTLAESQHKKAAFLREAVRALNLKTQVHAARAQELGIALKTTFDCITLRAVDNPQAALNAAIPLLNPQGWLALLTTQQSSETQSLPTLHWQPPHPLPPGTNRVLLLGQNY